MTAINVGVSISRTQSNRGPDRMTIRLTDEASRVEFVEVTLTLEQFTQAITSLQLTAPAEVRGLEHVGKTKVTERRTIELPMSLADTASREEVSEWLEVNVKEDGWFLDSYLGSRGSLTRDGGKAFANYKVFMFVDAATSAECES